jgi:hypothetical protein
VDPGDHSSGFSARPAASTFHWVCMRSLMEGACRRSPVADQSYRVCSYSTVTWDPATVALLVIDPWSFHWCKTACMRVGAPTRAAKC